MKADGTIWIDTKIDENGMEEGFRRMQDGADDVAVTVRKAGNAIESAFSKINVNKAVANAEAQLKSLEQQFEAISAEYADAIKFDDDKVAERLSNKRTAMYDRIARAREKLAIEVAAAAKKEAEAEEKATQKIIRSEQKEAKAREQAMKSQFDSAGNSAGYFGTRLRGIVSSAFVFNIISSGLRKVTAYFGSALMANNQFAYAVNRLKGSLMVAFQPIYKSVLPALVALINWLNVAVQAAARFFAILAGKSYKQMQTNAIKLEDAMGNVGDSIEDTGQKAKEAEKYLAGFDEINRMLSKDAADAAGDIGSGASDFKSPIFDEVQIPTEWETAIEKLAMRIKDIFFEWDNLTEEDVAEKLITALNMLVGGFIGFALGGIKGAMIGTIAGAVIGVLLSDMIFDGDGNLSGEEIGKSLIAVILGLSGALVGFFAGGPGGAAIGAAIGLGITFKLLKPALDVSSGEVSAQTVAEIMMDLFLGIAGAGIGFIVGNVPGALIGAVIGLGISLAIKSCDVLNIDGTISYEEILNGILDVLMVVCGAAIGFSAGGPAGAAIGAVIGLALAFTIPDVTFEGLQQVYDTLTGVVEESSAIVQQTTDEQLVKPTEKKFDTLSTKVESTWDEMCRIIKFGMQNAAYGVTQEFIEPTEAEFAEASQNIQKSMEEAKNGILFSMDMAAKGTDLVYIDPMEKESELLAESMIQDSEKAANKVVNEWGNAEREIQTEFLNPTKHNFAETSNEIAKRMVEAQDKIQKDWAGLPYWFQTKITSPMTGFFNELIGALVDGFNRAAQTIANAIQSLLNSINRIKNMAKSSADSFSVESSMGSARSSNAGAYYVAPAMLYPDTPEIPALARGAVIPPNRKFLAVLGDQRSGTNVEAPLETIQEAVAMVMEDVIQSNLAGHEATVEILRQILEAVLGIELDGETLTRVVNNHNRKMAMVRGG